MNIDNPKLIKQLESLVDNRQDWLFRFAYIRIGQIEKDTIYLKKFGIDFTHGARFLICDNTWNYFLNMATVQQRLLTITMLGGKKIRGFIEKFDDDKMSLNILFPKKASKRLVHRMHIAWICFDSQDEREIENRHGGKVEK